MKDFILYLINHLVDEPNKISLNEISGQQTIVYELRVGDEDMGKVIGRHGDTVRSLRTLLAATAAKEGKRIFLEVLDSEKKSNMFLAGKSLPM